LLRRNHGREDVEELLMTLREWELWCATSWRATCLSFLAYYRSQHDQTILDRALTAILDMWALILAGMMVFRPSSQVTFAMARMQLSTFPGPLGSPPTTGVNRLLRRFAHLQDVLAASGIR